LFEEGGPAGAVPCRQRWHLGSVLTSRDADRVLIAQKPARKTVAKFSYKGLESFDLICDIQSKLLQLV
jgi:hypothetical protein